MRHWPRAGVSEAPAAPGEAVVDGEALGLSFAAAADGDRGEDQDSRHEKARAQGVKASFAPDTDSPGVGPPPVA